jgi:hypothetical protein
MDSFSYPDILCLGMEGFVAKIRSKRNGKKNGRPTIKQEKRETFLPWEVERHCLNLDSGWRMCDPIVPSFPRPWSHLEL